VLAAVFYIGMDIVAAAFFYPGYDYTAQQVSELSAIGAPSRPFWLVASPIYTALTIAFGVGVVLDSGGRWSLRTAGILIVVFAILGPLWPPMHMRGTVAAQMPETDVFHIAFAAAAVLLMLLYMIAGAIALPRAFRIYSAITIVAMLGAGYAASLQIPVIAAGLPTPWMGLVERISVYGPMIWLAVFGIALLREVPARSRSGRPWGSAASSTLP
jgi:hypothetical protein